MHEIDSEYILLGGSRTGALFRDNAGDPFFAGWMEVSRLREQSAVRHGLRASTDCHLWVD
jgi:hypothetical protein